MGRAFELERRGNYAAAVEAYRGVLTSKPGDPAALLGLERALMPLGRSAEIVPDVRAALAANRSSGPVFGVALRTWSAADEPDSMRAVAERWAMAAPGDETPPGGPTSGAANDSISPTPSRPSWHSSPRRTETSSAPSGNGCLPCAACRATASRP